MMCKFTKRFAFLTLLIVVVFCLPLCGLAAEYSSNITTHFYFNQNGEVMVALLADDPEAYEGMSEFKRDWDGDGTATADECNENVTIEWFTEAGTVSSTDGFTTSVWDDGTVAIGNPVAWISGLQAEDDGTTVTMMLTNSKGDTFTAPFKLNYSGWIHNTPVITTDDEDYEFVKTGKNHYKLIVADGAEVSVDITDCMDADYDLVQDVTRTIYQIDPATEEATVIAEASFLNKQFADANGPGTEDDEISFTVSAEDPMNYRCNFMLVFQDSWIGGSTIYIDVEVRTESLTSNIPIYLMNSDNAQEIRCYGIMGMTHDSSLSTEDRNAWWDVYELAQNGQAAITWYSEDAALDALIKAHFNETEPVYLRIREETMDMEKFLNKTIVAAYSMDGETLGEMYFNIQNKPIEMLTWYEPTISPAATVGSEYSYDGCYTIDAVVGETVTIKMNYTYSGDINYLWNVNNEQQSNTTDTYSFTAAVEHDGMVIRNNAGRADYDSSTSTAKYEYATKFYINVEEPVEDETLTANVSVLVGESETDKQLYLAANHATRDASLTAEEQSVWNDIVNAMGQGAYTYRWTSADSYIQSIIDNLAVQPDQNNLLFVSEDGDLSTFLGKTISCAISENGTQIAQVNFTVSTETYEMPTWKEPTTTPAYADEAGVYVITAVEGSTVSIQMNHTYSKDLSYRWFINGEEIEHAEKIYSFAVTLAENDAQIRCITSSGMIEEANISHASSSLFVIKVLPKSDEEAYKVEYEDGIAEVPETLASNDQLNTPAKIESTMVIQVMAQASGAGMEISADQTAVYDVKLMYSEDGGVTWIEATEENWPESGKITVTLPYPEGTGQYTHNFVVAHMFTTTTEDHKAGDIEYPAVTNTAQGIQFQVSSLSPIAIAWEEKPEVPAVPATGDSSTPYLWMLGMLVAGAGCVMLVSKRRQNG